MRILGNKQCSYISVIQADTISFYSITVVKKSIIS